MAKHRTDITNDWADRHPWERLEREPPKAYQGFIIFRDMGPERTVSEAYRRYTNRPDSRAPGRFFIMWASEFNWRVRAQAYDDYCERLRLREQDVAIREAAKRHVKQLRNFAAVLNKFEQILMQKMEKNPDLKGVRLSDLMNAAVRGAAIVPRLQEAEMQALGKPSRIEVTGKDGGPITHNVRYIPPVILDPAAGTDKSDEQEDDPDELQ